MDVPEFIKRPEGQSIISPDQELTLVGIMLNHIYWRFNCNPRFIENMGVNHGRGNIAMP